MLVWQTGSYSNATDNLKVWKSTGKSAQNLRRIHENHAENLQVTHAEFSIFWRRLPTTL